MCSPSSAPWSWHTSVTVKIIYSHRYVQQAGQWFKTCCHREAELQPYCVSEVCVCVCFWSPETKCMQQSTGSSSADWLLGFSDDPDQLVFALCRNPSRSAEADLRREAAGRWPHALRLQHPEGEPGTPPQRNEGFSVNVDSEFSLRFRASVIQRSSDELLLCFLILPLFWV